MAGFMIPGQRYQDPSTGQWGTAQEHAERKRQQSIQQPYAENAPSAGAANKAAQQVNPNLNYTVGPTGQTTVSNQSAMDRMLEELRAKQATNAAQAGYANQTNQTQLQAQLAAEAAKAGYANQTSQAQLQAQLAAAAARGGYANQTAQAKLQAQLAEQAAIAKAARGDARFDKLSGLFGGIGVGPGAVGGAAPNPNPGGGGLSPQEQAARAAAFARAKDTAGQVSRSGLTSLQELMASRGISGSGIEGLMSAGVLSGAAAPVQELVRDQAISDVNRAGQVSDRDYQGDLTRRGQDLSFETARRNALLGLMGQLY